MRRGSSADLNDLLHRPGTVEIHPGINHLIRHLVHEFSPPRLVHFVGDLLEEIITEGVLGKKNLIVKKLSNASTRS